MVSKEPKQKEGDRQEGNWKMTESFYIIDYVHIVFISPKYFFHIPPNRLWDHIKEALKQYANLWNFLLVSYISISLNDACIIFVHQ